MSHAGPRSVGWQEMGDEAEQVQQAIAAKVGFRLNVRKEPLRAACRREVQTCTSRGPSNAVRWGTTIIGVDLGRTRSKRLSVSLKHCLMPALQNNLIASLRSIALRMVWLRVRPALAFLFGKHCRDGTAALAEQRPEGEVVQWQWRVDVEPRPRLGMARAAPPRAKETLSCPRQGGQPGPDHAAGLPAHSSGFHGENPNHCR